MSIAHENDISKHKKNVVIASEAIHALEVASGCRPRKDTCMHTYLLRLLIVQTIYFEMLLFTLFQTASISSKVHFSMSFPMDVSSVSTFLKRSTNL